MAIKDGQVANADEVINNLLGKQFKNWAQLLFNADLNGFNSNLNSDFENIVYDTLQDTSKIDTTNSDIDDLTIYSANILDDFEDGSIDTNIWTTATSTTGGGVSEINGYLYLTASADGTLKWASATANGTSAINFNQSCVIFSYVTVSRGTSSGSNKIILTDGTTEVDLWTKTSSVSNMIIRIEIDPTANQATVYENDINGSGSGSTVDISSLNDTSSWYIKYYVGESFNGFSSTFKIYHTRYLLNSSVTKNFISTATTSTSTITDAMLVVNKEEGTGSSATYYLSADGGTNYEQVTLNQIHRFTNTGTSLKLKVTMNSSTTKVYKLNHYAIMYNVGAS